jgi:hypothetical protein
MMFVVTPSLDPIEHKFNSKSIKFPKLHKVPILEAISINKRWSEWKERLRTFGVKPPKRGIELGWVTRGTRLKKPSSSRGFAREAHGARGSRGSWGLKTENQTFFSSLFQRRVRTDAIARPHRASEGVQREGEGKEMTSSARTGLCPCGCIVASARMRLCPRERRGASARTTSYVHGRIVASVRTPTSTWTVKLCPRVKPCPRDNCGRRWTSGQ